jgi:hypothetical protein
MFYFTLFLAVAMAATVTGFLLWSFDKDIDLW